mmetsp:Transcript_4602/g.29181  ORF Transcript_4602/g.29181 Transcript_4602/m.29181 type:complete len:83 (-) Transcript_4602:3-251(-)
MSFVVGRLFMELNLQTVVQTHLLILGHDTRPAFKLLAVSQLEWKHPCWKYLLLHIRKLVQPLFFEICTCVFTAIMNIYIFAL